MDPNKEVKECSREQAAEMIAELGGTMQPPPIHGSYLEMNPRHMPKAKPLVLFNFYGRMLYARCLASQAGPFPIASR